MSTRITNLTPGLATLPYPYRGAIAPGRGAILADDPATVLTKLGGILQVEGVWRLDLSSEPGQPEYSGTATPVVSYSSADRPLPGDATMGASPTNIVWIFNTTSNQPEYTDGTNWYDADGNVT